MARGFPAVWLIAGCACAWQRDVAGRMAGRACTNRPRLCPGDEVDACSLRLSCQNNSTGKLLSGTQPLAE